MLLEEQTAFCQALLNADLPAPDFARDPNGALAPKRFAVYRNNVVVSLVEALGAAYPGVKPWWGKRFSTPSRALMLFSRRPIRR